MKYTSTKLTQQGLSVSDEETDKYIWLCTINLLKNILENCTRILEVCKKKTVTVGILYTVSKVQRKTINLSHPKTMNGGTTLPSEYFGVESGNYHESVDFTKSFGIEDYAKSGIESTMDMVEQTNIVGGDAYHPDLYVNKDELVEIMKKMKKDLGIRTTKDADDMIFVSIDVNLHALFKEYKRKFKSKVIKIKNLKSLIEKNKLLTHFLI